jgi:hypothetical protein
MQPAPLLVSDMYPDVSNVLSITRIVAHHALVPPLVSGSVLGVMYALPRTTTM